MFGLLADRRFAGLFWTQFLGAFNDNLFKNALVLLILYRLAGASGPLLVTAAAGVFILPFFLFSAQAGVLADGMDKGRLARLTKSAEIGIMATGALGFALGSMPLLLVVLFLMGAQSAVFGPVKYGLLPDLLREDEVMGANALVEAATFLAILGGTITGGLLVLRPGGVVWTGALVVGLAVLGRLVSAAIPPAPARGGALAVPSNPLRAIGPALKGLRRDRRSWRAALGVSWFWFVGAVCLAQIPTLAKEVLGAGEGVVTLFLTLFSLGIGLGSLLAQALTHGRLRLSPVPLAGLGIALAALDLYLALSAWDKAPGLLGAAAFLALPGAWRIALDLVLLAAAGGVFVVPLMTAIQTWAPPGGRGRAIAALNVLNAAFMVASALFALALQALGFGVPAILLSTGLLTLPVAALMAGLVGADAVRLPLRLVLRLLCRVELRGWTGGTGGSVVVANHVSLLDGLLLLAFLPEKPVFAIDAGMAAKWWLRPFLGLAEALPLDPANPMALRRLAGAVREGRPLVIFPEGRITTTGGLMRVQEGPAVVAALCAAPVLPIRIEGAERSPFSRLRPTMTKRTWRPRIVLHMGVKERLPALRGRAGREAMARHLYDLMCAHHVRTEAGRRSLPEAVWDAARHHGMGRVILEDAQEQRVTYRHLFAGALVLGRRLAALAPRGGRVGVLLPNGAGAALALLGLWGQGRVAALLNPSAGLLPLRQGIEAARIDVVLTSSLFVARAELGGIVAGLEAGGVRLVHLEALAVGVGRWERLRALLATFKTACPLRPADGPRAPGPFDPAVVLFTSGSEGAPKGVVLSHDNLIANAAQGAVRFDMTHEDKVLGVLPLFHSFGLMGCLVLPLLNGVSTFLYPSPLHYRRIPDLAYATDATILFGTDTFLMGYARKADPLDFHRLRYVLAGAEPLKAETRRVWMERFGVRVLEGYGLTEASPVVALNTALYPKPGTVGRPLPLVEHRLVPVDGIKEGGRLLVRGPNVMLGYLLIQAPGELRPPDDGWHDTGDVLAADDEGYLRVVGRIRRFAKLGGEMVSLAAVEALAERLWPDAQHGVVAVADPRKGERLVLVTTAPEANRRHLHDFLKEAGAGELLLPGEVRVVETLPLLATGKTDHMALKHLVETGQGRHRADAA